jgi:hypothetical protein
MLEAVMTRSVALRVLAVMIVSFATAALSSPALADLDAAEAEELITTLWYEGLPAERVEPLTAGALAYLGEILDDPAASDRHAAALELLGRAGGAGAYEKVAAYAANVPSGAIDGSLYRAQLAVPMALGYLARGDDRALSVLLTAADREGEVSWSYRQLSRSRIGSLLRRNALSGLALSRRSAASARLRDLANRGDGGAALRAHASALLADDAVMGREER